MLLLLVEHLQIELDDAALTLLLALGSGLRMGEAIGLRWSRIDFERGLALVDQSIYQVGKKDSKTVGAKGTKSGKERWVPVPPYVLDRLREHQARQATWVLACGSGYKRLDLVNPLPDGSYWPPQRFEGGYRRMCGRIGFPELQGIDLLRHTFATRLAAAGVDSKTIQYLGHSSASFTVDRYCQTSMENVRSAGAVSQRMFSPARVQDANGEQAESGKA